MTTERQGAAIVDAIVTVCLMLQVLARVTKIITLDIDCIDTILKVNIFCFIWFGHNIYVYIYSKSENVFWYAQLHVHGHKLQRDIRI